MLPHHHHGPRPQQPQPHDKVAKKEKNIIRSHHPKNPHLSAFQIPLLHATYQGVPSGSKTTQHPHQSLDPRAENMRFRVSKNPIKIIKQRRLYLLKILPRTLTCHERNRLQNIDRRVVSRLHYRLISHT